MYDPQAVQMIMLAIVLAFFLALIIGLIYGLVLLTRIRKQVASMARRLDEFLIKTGSEHGSSRRPSQEADSTLDM
ncbi:MAG TPA: hypothetical protein VFC10_08410 [Terriglobia bacterium]|jgi:uncharacterized protein YneF (UPF0154 family)|nr:hypothetical protein [Terriglobia bacterium]